MPIDARPIVSTAVASALEGSLADWEQVYLAHASGKRSDLIPFPDENIQRLTNSAAGEDSARDGIQILRQLLLMAQEIRPLPRTSRVLDYGCGWGRLTRLLPYCIDIENIVGIDVDERLISSANELLPFLDHRLIESMTPLPFDDHSFDLVFANSVFSHLSLPSHRYAMGEIARVLKLGELSLPQYWTPSPPIAFIATPDSEAGSRESSATPKPWLPHCLPPTLPGVAHSAGRTTDWLWSPRNGCTATGANSGSTRCSPSAASTPARSCFMRHSAKTRYEKKPDIKKPGLRTDRALGSETG
jgi:SAM-dependent methyltransferase